MCVVAEIDGDGVLGMDFLSKLNLQMSRHVREMKLHKPPNIRKINNENLETILPSQKVYLVQKKRRFKPCSFLVQLFFSRVCAKEWCIE